LEFYRLAEGRVETRYYGACGVDLVAELALVFVLLHIIELDVLHLSLLFVDTVKDLLLLLT